MTQFINKREDIVSEAIDGLVSASGGRLARLDGYPHIRVVVRNDWDRSRVAIVSGVARVTSLRTRGSSAGAC